MSRALFIVGMVFAIVFMIVTGYYADEVQSARWDYIFNDYDYGYSDYNYSSYSSYNNSDDLTMEAGLWSLFFFFFYIAVYILGLLKVKTKSMKVFAIIGLSITGIYLLLDCLLLVDPGAVSFDEMAPLWVLYCFIMLAFTIVGLVQSVRYLKIAQRGSLTDLDSGVNDILDS